MQLKYNIFTLKTVSFDQGERDPFGFDDYSEKLGAEYLPFSGTVSKPSYFLFVTYVNYFLNTNKTLWKSDKQKNEIQTRLEKLLVYCWKNKANEEKNKANEEKEVLRGSAIIGNSFDINDIDVFSGKGWVKQNAFRIYNDNKFASQIFEFYKKVIGERQMLILSKFISADFKNPDFDKKKFLKKIVDDLQKSEYSLFSGHKFKRAELKKRFRDELKLKIQKKNKDVHYDCIRPFFENGKFDNFWNETLDKKELPFVHLNNWFVAFVNAVDADINDKSNRQLLWDEANKYFTKIKPKFLSTSKSEIVLKEKMKTKTWFEYNEKEKRYSFPERGNKSENRRIENLWESYKKRQGEEVGTRFFFNFRHYALLRLLKELQ